MVSSSNSTWLFSPLKSLRTVFRYQLFNVLKRLGQTDDAKALVVETLGDLLDLRKPHGLPIVNSAHSHYPDLGTVDQGTSPAERSDIIILSGRFRSGSTFLWNLFRQLGDCTSYYEPFNERRWFDKALRGQGTDSSHKNVTDYWSEYDGLDILGDYYSEEWIRRELFMDAHSWNPAMKRYIEIMVEQAPQRPVLQFNRIDFRLPWIRHNFPNAKIIHLFRHPRDEWYSSLFDTRLRHKECTMQEFLEHEGFYLGAWGRDLKYQFPFVDPETCEHPYHLFYFIWRLSFLFGLEYAHYSVAYEDIMVQPEDELGQLFDFVGVDPDNFDALMRNIQPAQSGRWMHYADDEWFKKQESQCETIISEFLQPTTSHDWHPRRDPVLTVG